MFTYISICTSFFFLLSFPSPNCRYGILVPLVKHTWVVLDSWSSYEKHHYYNKELSFAMSNAVCSKIRLSNSMFLIFFHILFFSSLNLLKTLGLFSLILVEQLWVVYWTIVSFVWDIWRKKGKVMDLSEYLVKLEDDCNGGFHS